MNFWIYAQLPPNLANWLVESFNVNATAIRDLGLRDAEDIEIFNAARSPGTVIVSKDSDFVELVIRLGTPPQILWLTCGNVTNRKLQRILSNTFAEALRIIEEGEAIVEISDH